MKFLILTLILLGFGSSSFCAVNNDIYEVVFSGRVSKLSQQANLIRFKIDFENAKFLSKNDRIEIWNPSYPEKRCLGFVEGRSSSYLLIRLPKFEKCKSSVYFTTGSYMQMFSPNLEINLGIARELVEVLHKKRTALGARKARYERVLSGFIEKIDVTNRRYELLRQKLDLEWQRELSNLEEDKSKSYTLLKEAEASLHDIEYKLQQYRVRDQNLVEDRWSLDPKLFIKK